MGVEQRAREVARCLATTPVAWVAALTALGFALRAAGLSQSLFADELSTYALATLAEGPRDVIELIRHGEELRHTDRYVIELTPPLYFLVAWTVTQVTDPDVAIRIPSLIAGTLIIPAVYAVGARTVGRGGALVAAALAAINPFLIYYSVEARAFGPATLLVLLSTLALLRATETRAPAWWAAYAVASCTAVYTHYLAALVLLAQFLWAVWAHRDRWRPLLLANVAAALAFVPWIPTFLDHSRSPWNVIPIMNPFGFSTLVDDVTMWATGYPILSRSEVPSVPSAVMIALGVLVAVAGLAVMLVRRRRSGGFIRPSPGAMLVAVLALAAPVGLTAYSIVGTDVMLPRNLLFSSPGLMLALGGLVFAVRMSLRVIATVLVLSGFSIGTVTAVFGEIQRPDFRAAASFVESHTRAGDPVVEIEPLESQHGPLSRHLEIHLDDRRIVRADGHSLEAEAAELPDDTMAIVIASPRSVLDPDSPPPPPSVPSRFDLVEAEVYPGTFDVWTYAYVDRG